MDASDVAINSAWGDEAEPLDFATSNLTVSLAINRATTTQILAMPGLQCSTLEKDKKEIRLLIVLPRGQNA